MVVEGLIHRRDQAGVDAVLADLHHDLELVAEGAEVTSLFAGQHGGAELSRKAERPQGGAGVPGGRTEESLAAAAAGGEGQTEHGEAEGEAATRATGGATTGDLAGVVTSGVRTTTRSGRRGRVDLATESRRHEQEERRCGGETARGSHRFTLP